MGRMIAQVMSVAGLLRQWRLLALLCYRIFRVSQPIGLLHYLPVLPLPALLGGT